MDTPRQTLESGTVLETKVFCPTAVDLFRFSAATNNPHLIHYNEQHAAGEGFRGVVVQSHLHAAYLHAAVSSWFVGGRVRQLNWRNLQVAVAGDVLSVSGRVVSTSFQSGLDRTELEIVTTNQLDEAVVSAQCVVEC
jgi:hydroxyacyl-ACP dehydratase HTD2-like protein with hotdog domain